MDKLDAVVAHGLLWAKDAREYVNNFEVIMGTTLGMRLDWMIAAPLGYLATLFGLTLWMRNRKGFALKGFSVVHNLLLTLTSCIMAMGVAYGAYQMAQEHGAKALVCLPRSAVAGKNFMRGPIMFWAYVWWATKIPEWIDSIILVLKKSKGLSFLHVFHHAVMPLFSMVWFYSEWPQMYQCVFMNSCVHTAMYLYYMLASLGHRSPLKRYLTRMQIIQFVLGLALTHVWLWMRRAEGCVGEFKYLVVPYFSTWIFLVLFVQFYIQEYRSDKRAAKAAAVAKAAGVDLTDKKDE